MDNQHRKIKGYRELSQDEINKMNEVKELANKVGELIASLDGPFGGDGAGNHMSHADGRWLAIAKTDLQKGFMALTRAIAQPEFF